MTDHARGPELLPEPRRVAVTGASGFIGRHLCAAWSAAGVEVRALVREGSSRPPPDGSSVEVVPYAGVHDRAGLKRAFQGADAVVHLAARVHVMDAAQARTADFDAVNVEGTRIVLEETLAAGAPRFVLISSVKAVGEATEERAWDGTEAPDPQSPYGRSKLAAERLLRGHAGLAGLHAPILRLPLVHGPGVGGNMLRLLRLVARGAPIPLGGIRNRRSLAYVGNVARAIRAVLRAPSAADRAFFVADDRALSTPELIGEIAAAMGRPARLVPFPARALRGLAALADAVRPVVRLPLSRGAVDRLVGSLVVDASELGRLTPYVPEATVTEGLGRMVDWFLAQRSVAPAEPIRRAPEAG